VALSGCHRELGARGLPACPRGLSGSPGDERPAVEARSSTAGPVGNRPPAFDAEARGCRGGADAAPLSVSCETGAGCWSAAGLAARGAKRQSPALPSAPDLGSPPLAAAAPPASAGGGGAGATRHPRAAAADAHEHRMRPSSHSRAATAAAAAAAASRIVSDPLLLLLPPLPAAAAGSSIEKLSSRTARKRFKIT
jgi:hypothetical protein